MVSPESIPLFPLSRLDYSNIIFIISSDSNIYVFIIYLKTLVIYFKLLNIFSMHFI